MSQRKREVVLMTLAIVGVATTCTIFGIHRSVGAYQTTSGREAAGTVKNAAPPQGPALWATEIPPKLNPRLRERLTLARVLRDEAFRLDGGGDDVERFLIWQKRFDDLIAEGLAADRKNADLVKILEADIRGLKMLEQVFQERKEGGFVSEIPGMTIRFYRLDVEEKLDRVRAH